jgi:hypothetical protein
MNRLISKNPQGDDAYSFGRGRGLEGGLGGFSLGISKGKGSGSLDVGRPSSTRVAASHTDLAAGTLNHKVSAGG